MGQEPVKRRLTSILAADIVGFSRLMHEDEVSTLAALKQRRKSVLEPLVANYQGRIFKIIGDGVLIEFPSAVNAVDCAIDLQHGMEIENGDLPKSRHITLRIGVNLGDVIVEGTDLYGDGVNIAARLEAISEPGGIAISGSVYDQVKNKVKEGFDDFGLRSLKNISEQVRVYHAFVTPDASVGSPQMPAAKPSIVVLPFSNLSGDPAQEYFSDGVTEDTITGLSRFHELFVIAHSSSFAFKGSPRTAREISAELGVKYVVEGSVRKFSGTLRLSVQLLEGKDGRQLWAEHYDRSMEDIFAVQDAITQAIAATVTGRVIESAHERAVQKSQEHLLAYDCWLRGQHQLLLWDPESDLQALAWFEQALEKDPHFARAHSSIALLLNARTLTSPGLPEEATDRRCALRHARLSIEYDNSDARSHLSLAWVSLFLSDLARAARHFRISEDLNPNAADNLMNCAVATAYFGDTARGMALADRARTLNPLHADWYYYMLAQIHFLARQFDEAFQIGHTYAPEFPELCGWTTAALGILSRENEAKDEAARFLKTVEGCWVGSTPMRPEDAVSWFMSVNKFLRDGDKQLLLRGLKNAGLATSEAAS